MKTQQSPVEHHAGGAPVSGLILQPKYWLALAFFAFLSFFVVGCGSSGDDPVFITDDGTIIGGGSGDPDTSDPDTSDPDFLPPVARIVGSDTVLAPGATTVYAVALVEPARNELRVNLLVVGDATQFEVSDTVTIPAGQSAVVFPVRATETAVIGSSIEIIVAASAAYSASLFPVRVSVVGEDLATALPSVRLLEVDSSVTPGSSTTYGLVLDQPTQTDISISILTVSSSGAFEVDDEVTILAGSSAASFEARALASAEAGASAILQLVAGTGYRVGSPADVRLQVVAEPDTRPQLSLLGGAVDGAQQEPTKTLTPAQADQAGSTTTLALVLDRPAPEDITVNYVMVGNAEAFTVDGANPLAGEPLLIPAGARAVPFTVQTSLTGRLFDAAELQILGGEAYTVEGESNASFVITLDRLPFATLAPGSLDVPLDDFRNAAVILDPERPPAPLPPAAPLRINYVLVGDPRVVQDEGDITERDPGGAVDGTDPVSGIVEVNNAEPLTIAPGDFAVTFQVRRQQTGAVTMILIGGDGYTVPEWTDPKARLDIGGGSLEFSGNGSAVVPFRVPSDGAVFFDLTHSGSSNFIVRLRDGDANEVGPLLANEIGSFEGTVVRNLDAGDYLLDITADGDWTANVRF